jgi:thymidine kinase
MIFILFSLDKIKMLSAKNGSCRIIYGCMFSAKSTKLRQEITTLADVGFDTLYINHPIDVRKTESQDRNITTHHSGFKGLSDKVTCIKTDKLSKVNVSKYNAIAIDEGQFFSKDDIEIVRDWIENKNKIVIIASLDGDYKRKSFGKVYKLIPLCESGNIEKLHAFCEKCGPTKRVKAHFTAKFNASSGKNYNQIEVGGRDTYLPVCGECYQEHMKLTEEIIIPSIDLDMITPQGITMVQGL